MTLEALPLASRESKQENERTYPCRRRIDLRMLGRENVLEVDRVVYWRS